MNIDLKVEQREVGKKSELNNMRRSGFIPGTIYMGGKESKLIKIDSVEFIKQYRKTLGELVLYNIWLDDKKHHSLIKEKQIHPVTRDILHLDFLEIDKNKKLTVDVPFNFVGTPIGVQNGGALDIILRKIEITCLLKDILEDIEVDISSLDIGDSIHISDLKLDNVEISLPPDVTIAVVQAPQAVVEPAEEAEEEKEEGTEEAEEPETT